MGVSAAHCPPCPWHRLINIVACVLQREVASVKAAMAKRVEEAVAETEAKASGLRDAREKNVHFSARVVRTPGPPHALPHVSVNEGLK